MDAGAGRGLASRPPSLDSSEDALTELDPTGACFATSRRGGSGGRAHFVTRRICGKQVSAPPLRCTERSCGARGWGSGSHAIPDPAQRLNQARREEQFPALRAIGPYISLLTGLTDTPVRIILWLTEFCVHCLEYFRFGTLTTCQCYTYVSASTILLALGARQKTGGAYDPDAPA